MRRHVERLIQHEAKPSAVFASFAECCICLKTPTQVLHFFCKHMQAKACSALSDILYCTSWLSFHRVIFSITKTIVIRLSVSVHNYNS